MSAALITLLLTQVLPLVLQELPAIIAWLKQNEPALHAQVQSRLTEIRADSGPNFKFHNGP